MVVFYVMKSRNLTYVYMLFVTVNAILLCYVTNNDRTLEALPLSNSTEQMIRLQSVISNQSDDIKAIRNSTAAQVQVLKSMAEHLHNNPLKLCTLL